MIYGIHTVFCCMMCCVSLVWLFLFVFNDAAVFCFSSFAVRLLLCGYAVVVGFGFF